MCVRETYIARVLYVPKSYIHICRKMKDPTKFVQCCDVRWNRNFAKSRWTRSKTRHFRLRWGDRRPPETPLCVFKLARNYFGGLVNLLEAPECVYLRTRFTLIVVACLSKIAHTLTMRKENDSRDKRKFREYARSSYPPLYLQRRLIKHVNKIVDQRRTHTHTSSLANAIPTQIAQTTG